MDDSPLRRGKPTVHNEWDQNIAILSGDAMVFIAYEQLIQTKSEVISDLIQIFNQTAMEVCEGQQYDMNFESRLDVRETEYLKMIELKTAILMGASLKIGSIIGGANASDAKYIYSFGENLGMAFQLQDDLLDVYGDPKIFGKKIGGDIVAGKKTYLLVKTMELANESIKGRIKTTLNNINIKKEDKIRIIKSVYDQLGIKDIVNDKMNGYFLKANEALKKVQVEKKRKEELFKLASSLLNREK
jgi:geranylgeranyl diphosphate synthase type II